MLDNCRRGFEAALYETQEVTLTPPAEADDSLLVPSLTSAATVEAAIQFQFSASFLRRAEEFGTTPFPDTPPSEPMSEEVELTFASSTVVNALALDLRERPDIESAVAGLLNENDLVQVFDWEWAWRFVCCLADGITAGWVLGECLHALLAGDDKVPRAAIALYSEGFANTRQRHWGEAIAEFDKAASIEPRWTLD